MAEMDMRDSFIYMKNAHARAFFLKKCAMCGWIWDYLLRKILSFQLIFIVHLYSDTPQSNKTM